MKLPINAMKDTKAQRAHRLDTIFDLISDGVTVSSACKKAGIARKTFYSWMNADVDLLARYEHAIMERHDQVAEVIQLCALKALTDHRYQTSAIFYAKCKMNWNDGTGFTTGTQDMPSITFKTKPKPKPEPEPQSDS